MEYLAQSERPRVYPLIAAGFGIDLLRVARVMEPARLL
jgi:hypothetical protein